MSAHMFVLDSENRAYDTQLGWLYVVSFRCSCERYAPNMVHAGQRWDAHQRAREAHRRHAVLEAENDTIAKILAGRRRR